MFDAVEAFGLDTYAHASPSQVSVSERDWPPLLKPPTAAHEADDTQDTALSPVVAPPKSGTSTLDQFVPSHCTTSSCASGPIVVYPTAAHHVDDTHETDCSELSPVPGLGLGAVAHCLPSQIMTSVRSAVPELTLPTAAHHEDDTHDTDSNVLLNEPASGVVMTVADPMTAPAGMTSTRPTIGPMTTSRASAAPTIFFTVDSQRSAHRDRWAAGRSYSSFEVAREARCERPPPVKYVHSVQFMVKRPYLRTDDRRQQLLEATSRLLARNGLLGITMVAVAAEAGVSRRLVYDHFTDLTSLFEAFFEDRANRSLVAIDRAILTGEGPASGVAGSYAELLAMPIEDQQAIRLLVAGPGLPALESVRARFREHIEQRWLPRLPVADTEMARALLWTLVSGVLGLAELVERGDLSKTAALELAKSLAMSMPAALAAASAELETASSAPSSAASSAARRLNTST